MASNITEIERVILSHIFIVFAPDTKSMYENVVWVPVTLQICWQMILRRHIERVPTFPEVSSFASACCCCCWRSRCYCSCRCCYCCCCCSHFYSCIWTLFFRRLAWMKILYIQYTRMMMKVGRWRGQRKGYHVWKRAEQFIFGEIIPARIPL